MHLRGLGTVACFANLALLCYTMGGLVLRKCTAPPWCSSRRNETLKEGKVVEQTAFQHRIQAMRRRLEALQQATLSESDRDARQPDRLRAYSILLEELNAVQEAYRQEHENVLAARRAADDQRLCYRELLDFAPDGYLLTDSDGVIREANRAALHLLAADRGSLRDQPLDDYVSLQDRANFRDLLARLKAGGEVEGQERVVYLQPRGGSAFPVALNVAPRHETEGCPLGLLWRLDDLRMPERGGTRDRLMLELAEDVQSLEDLILALERERETLLLIMENTDAQLAYLDRDFNFILVNSAYARGARRTFQELVGRNHFDLFPNAENEAIFEGVRDFGRPVQYRARPFEYHDRPELGTTYWDWTLVPVKDAHGTVRGLVLSLVDVTDRVRAAQEREQLLAEHQRQRLFLERLVETAPIGIAVVHGPDHRYEVANPNYQALVGWPGTAMAGRAFAEVLPEVAVQGAMRLLEAAYSSDRSFSIDEYRASTGTGGEEAYWSLDIVPLNRPGADEQRALVLVCDVTEQVVARRQIEKLAVEAQRQADGLAAIFAAMSDSVIVYDAEGVPIQANRVSARLYGLDPADYEQAMISLATLSRQSGQVRVPRDRETIIRRVNLRHRDGRAVTVEELPSTRALRGEHVVSEPYLLTQPDGQERIFLISASPIVTNGRPSGAVAVSRDITEREREEQARQRLIAILEATPDVVATASSDGQVLYLNRAGRELLGVREGEDVAGWTISDCHPAWADKIVHEEGIPTAVRDGLWHGETAIRSHDGREIPVSQVILAHKAPDGSLEYLSTIMRDVRERKKIERDLSDYTRRLQVLHSVDHAIIAADSVDTVAEIVLSHIRQVVPCIRASVVLFDLPAGQASLLAVNADGETRLPRGWRGPLDESWSLGALAQGDVNVIEDLQAMESARSVLQILQEEGVRCHVSFPLRARGTLIGALDLGLAEPGEPLPEQMDAVHEMAFGLAITIQHIRLAEEVQHYSQELEGRGQAKEPGTA
jgi:PAS domain S-box-containing protein